MRQKGLFALAIQDTRSDERRDTMKRLSEYAPKLGDREIVNLEDVEGLELTIQDARFTRGTYGEYAFVDIKNQDGNELTLITGAQLVMKALKRVADDDAFPVVAKFRKQGRMWTIE